MSYILTLQTNPGKVTGVSDGALAVAGDIVVETLPSGGYVGNMYYVDGAVVLEGSLTDAQQAAIASAEAGESQETAAVGTLATRSVTLLAAEEEETEEGEEDPEESTENTLTAETEIDASGMLTTILIQPSEWALSGSGNEARYTMALSNPGITQSTVLVPLEISIDTLPSDMRWASGEGAITFTLEEAPMQPITIAALLMDTREPVPATGVLRAHPGASWAAVTYRQSLHVEDWQLPIAEGASVAVQTPVNFAAAKLRFATPGAIAGENAEGVLVTGVYLNAGGYLCFRLYNAGAGTATVTDVDLRVLYGGRLSGFVSDNEDDETVAEYISYQDYSQI